MNPDRIWPTQTVRKYGSTIVPLRGDGEVPATYQDPDWYQHIKIVGDLSKGKLKEILICLLNHESAVSNAEIEFEVAKWWTGNSGGRESRTLGYNALKARLELARAKWLFGFDLPVPSPTFHGSLEPYAPGPIRIPRSEILLPCHKQRIEAWSRRTRLYVDLAVERRLCEAEDQADQQRRWVTVENRLTHDFQLLTDRTLYYGLWFLDESWGQQRANVCWVGGRGHRHRRLLKNHEGILPPTYGKRAS